MDLELKEIRQREQLEVLVQEPTTQLQTQVDSLLEIIAEQEVLVLEQIRQQRVGLGVEQIQQRVGLEVVLTTHRQVDLDLDPITKQQGLILEMEQITQRQVDLGLVLTARQRVDLDLDPITKPTMVLGLVQEEEYRMVVLDLVQERIQHLVRITQLLKLHLSKTSLITSIHMRVIK